MDEFFTSFLEELKEEDAARSLHSRDTEKASNVEWPKFSGKEIEDFAKIKEKPLHAFKQAKTSRDAKVDKLRALLSGHAKDLVPDGVKDIDSAFATLANAFGDPSRLVDFKLKLLNDAGMLPSADKKGFRAQVSFYLKLQGIVEDLLSLGEHSDELALHPFHRSSIHALANRFPTNLRTKLIVHNSKLKGRSLKLVQRRINMSLLSQQQISGVSRFILLRRSKWMIALFAKSWRNRAAIRIYSVTMLENFPLVVPNF